jgi:hypothetical protein
MNMTLKIAAAGLATAACVTPLFAQRGAAAQSELWWVEKTPGGVYKPPNRPLWKLADLKKMHAGQSNWQQQIVLDADQDATYNSGAPGFKISTRMHPFTPTVFVVIAGELHFNVEGQQPVTATRGAIVNIMRTTFFSYDVTGDHNALWIEINPVNYKTVNVYPAAGPAPAPGSKDGKIVKVLFNHSPGAYTKPNQLMFNTFDDVIAKCVTGFRVVDDHVHVAPLLGYVNLADNKCGTGSLNIGSGPDKPDAPAFNPHTDFGHLHAGPVEWWIVQVGAIMGKFESMGEYHAVEGDVLYAASMGWHQMAAEAPSGPSVRLAISGYQLINMYNTADGSAGDR